MTFDNQVIYIVDAIYLAVATAVGLGVMFWDKTIARHNEKRTRQGKKTLRRVPEKTLFILAGVGCSLGVWGGMYLFHHKTRHRAFVWGVPAIVAAQVVLGVLVLARPF